MLNNHDLKQQKRFLFFIYIKEAQSDVTSLEVVRRFQDDFGR